MKIPPLKPAAPYLLIIGGAVLTLLLGLWFLLNQFRMAADMVAEQHLVGLQVAYRGATESPRPGLEASLRHKVLQPEVLKLLAAAQTTAEEDLPTLRGRLYQLLRPEYDQLLAEGLDIFQFHLADDRVLLRFHRPNKAGDPLYELRPALRRANNELVPVSGLETGRSHHGFRYIYPLVIDRQHLGSVEYGLPFDAIHHRLLHLLGGGDYLFLLNREDILAKVDPDQQEKFTISPLHPLFLVETPSIAQLNRKFRYSEQAGQLSARLRHHDRVQQGMAAGRSLAVPFFHEGRGFVAAMLPISDTTGQPVAYIAGYQEAPVLISLRRAKLRDGIVGLLGVILVTVTLWRLCSQKVILRQQIATNQQVELALERLAHYDALTALPNRVLLADRLNQAMGQTTQQGNQLALAYLDLDGFKEVNDTHGHEVGDRLLCLLAIQMQQVLQETDTLARLGGDEFVAIIRNLPDEVTCLPILQRLLQAASSDVEMESGGLALRVSASLGVTFYPQREKIDADQLLRQADQAMYKAKQAGKNRYHLFDADRDLAIRSRHELLERLSLALTNREFVLYYQPKVNMRQGTVVGLEALIRWQHPEQGLLAPAHFIPAVEDHPLAVEIDDWVLGNALEQLASWQRQGLQLPVSVNIGALQLQRHDFIAKLQQQLAAWPEVAATLLELEVVESSALEDIDHVAQLINHCQALGVNFALDDFGTGYSSLTYLKRLTAKTLKIDQSFVRNMLENPDDLAILEGVMGLASAFRRQVVAEGVETETHGRLLLDMGCEVAQGYGIARPMPAAEVAEWAASWRPYPSWHQ